MIWRDTHICLHFRGIELQKVRLKEFASLWRVVNRRFIGNLKKQSIYVIRTAQKQLFFYYSQLL